MMLPFSLVIFGNFSIYHPLSILWTVLFSIFYPLSIFLHIIGFGDIFDTLLKYLIELAKNNRTLNIDNIYLYIHIVLSLASLWKKHILFLLIIYTIWIFYNSIELLASLAHGDEASASIDSVYAFLASSSLHSLV